MTTVYWNPQVNPFTSTSNDDVVLSWGTGVFDTLLAKTLSVQGGVKATIGSTTATVLEIANGTDVTITAAQAADFTSIDVQGGATLRIEGQVTTGSLTIGNGAHVYMDGGLSTDKFSIAGGAYLQVSGYMSISSQEIKAEGDVSYIWDSKTHSGSTVIHNHGTEACYLAGTDILTPSGMVPVEELCVGDYVIAYDEHMHAAPKQIVWTGHGRHVVDPRYTKGYADVSGVPVCIRADMFGPGMPYRDLYVTPEHMILVDGYFTPVRLLVDGVGIYYVHGRTDYDFYHFCFDEHAVVSANGLFSESFLPSDQVFSEETRGELPENKGMARGLNALGAYVIREQQAARSEELGYTPMFDPNAVDVHTPGFVSVWTNRLEKMLTPLRKTETSVTYQAPHTDTLLFFNTTRPCDSDPSSDDRREMGPPIDIVGITCKGKIIPMDQLDIKGMHDQHRPYECVRFNSSGLSQFVISRKV